MFSSYVAKIVITIDFPTRPEVKFFKLLLISFKKYNSLLTSMGKSITTFNRDYRAMSYCILSGSLVHSLSATKWQVSFFTFFFLSILSCFNLLSPGLSLSQVLSMLNAHNATQVTCLPALYFLLCCSARLGWARLLAQVVSGLLLLHIFRGLCHVLSLLLCFGPKESIK